MAVPRKRDFYEVLDVGRDATDAQIKRAFRDLAKKFHPDKNPGDRAAEDRFKEANEAYAILSDPDKRAAYDRFGHSAFGSPNQRNQNMATAPGPTPSVGEMFGGLLDMLGRRKKTPGRDLRYTLELEFREAAFGVEKVIHFPTRKDCAACHGTGARGEAGLKACAACAGRGQVRSKQGVFNLPRTCTACGGSGKVVVDACPTCEGAGRVRIEREFTVKLPPGIEDGAVRRVPREGEPGRAGGPPGDLQVVVRVKPHPVFTRAGHDLVCELPISFVQAALGAQLDVPTLDGVVKMRIPEGTQSGRMFRLRGKGIPKSEGKNPPRGDQNVRVVVETPSILSPAQRQLYEQLAALEDADDAAAYPIRRRFLDKVRTGEP